MPTEKEVEHRNFIRGMSVYKRDDMIQQARMGLTLMEQKCVLYAISKVKPGDTILQEYEFDIKEFYLICGIENESYTRLKKILKDLRDKSWWVITENGEETPVSWFNKVRISKQAGKVSVRFDDDMMPYLLNLREDGSFYTRYMLRYVLPLNCMYAPRLYELLKSYAKNNISWFFEIEKLKFLLDAEKYERWPDFRRRVLEPAVKEINDFTDIKVDYQLIKEGNRVCRIRFFMEEKDIIDRFRAEAKGEELMDGDLE